MKKIVIKFGGSVLYKEEMVLNIEKINEIVDTITALHDAGHEIAVVVGGGKLARIIIQASDVLGHVTTFKDILAVESTRIDQRIRSCAFFLEYHLALSVLLPGEAHGRSHIREKNSQ